MEQTVARSRSVVLICSVAVLGLLATATITFAASKRMQAAAPHPTAVARTQREPLVVPDVRGKPYVFAKGMLEDSGFAWHVSTRNGYAANVVVSQSPTAGTRVVDTGAPAVVLSLQRAGDYDQKGSAENESPFAGTPLQLIGETGTTLPADVEPLLKPARVKSGAARKTAATRQP
jgi:hypothetical protein